MKHEFFKNEIEMVQSEDIRMFLEWFLDEIVPDYFWEIGASSSGKYHPQFSQGNGGLVRHTKAVCLFAQELLRMSSYAYMNEEYKDFVMVACICHDTAKYGKTEFNKDEYADHARNASEMVEQAWFEYFGTPAHYLLTNAIKSHMGQWSTEREDRPFTSVDRCVHMADYMASRPFIDIPQINKEWVLVQYGVDHLPECPEEN